MRGRRRGRGRRRCGRAGARQEVRPLKEALAGDPGEAVEGEAAAREGAGRDCRVRGRRKGVATPQAPCALCGLAASWAEGWVGVPVWEGTWEWSGGGGGAPARVSQRGPT